MADGNFAAPNPGFAWPIQALNGSSNTRRAFCSDMMNEEVVMVPSSSSSSLACFGSALVATVQSLSSYLENQRVEMDWFLKLKNKRLRKLILEEQKRQQAVLLLECESRIKNLMPQKDEELTLARTKQVSSKIS
ncbi:hypothetical protein PHJA_000886100 [Phtheirospermum japonicum]|uniref:Uncharacterized protein n=1 Tax=Phtheirospermum japonicum TaxID=374723 RepID=A0A830BSK1_9LAMI|nr:hypothetical protein PHJA_000886100 [Phtheirospermum japonicum]